MTYEELEQKVEKLESRITDLTIIKDELEETNEIFNLFMEYNPVYTFFKDKGLRSIKLSKNYEQMLGKPVKEILGKTMDEVFPADLAKSMIADDLSILEGRKPLKVVEEFNGRHYETLKFPIVIDDEPKYLAGYTMDITERKQDEEKKKKLLKQFHNALEIAGLAPWEFDIQNNRLILNDFFYNILRTSSSVMGGYNITLDAYFQCFIYPEDVDYIKNYYLEAKKTKDSDSSWQFEHRILFADGKAGHLNVRFFVVRDENGKAIKTYGVVQDITDRKLAEKRLRENEEKLARSKKMESLGLLAGGVAHDLNNVLAGIVSYPDLFLMDFPEDEIITKRANAMKESGNRAVAIVQDLLTVARGVASVKEPLNLNNIINDYLTSPEFKKLQLYHPLVEIRTDLGSDLLNIKGSQVHLRKVVMNLVSNASEAIESVGEVVVSTFNEHVNIPLRGYQNIIPGEYVVLCVSDTGSGISSEDLEKIFEPFFTKKVLGRSGTGLGLSVVWNTVQDHDGYIDVSSYESGTYFKIYFQVTKEKLPDRNNNIPLADYKGCGEKLLIVDDVQAQRDVLEDLLQKLGYEITSVASGEEAVEYIKNNPVDLILLDMIMDPGINGRETYERIIKINPKQKAILVSGLSETDEVKEAQRLGAGKYIKKPLTLETIGLAIKKSLKKK